MDAAGFMLTVRGLQSTLQKTEWLFDLAVVILVAVLSDTQDAYQFRVEMGT